MVDTAACADGRTSRCPERSSRMRRSVVIAACCGGACWVPRARRRAAGHVPPVLGGAGASTLGGLVNFVAVRAGRGTIVARSGRGGRCRRARAADPRRATASPAPRRRLDHRALRRRRTLVLAERSMRSGTRLLVVWTRERSACASGSRCPSSSPSTRSRPTAARSTCCATRRPAGGRYDVMALDLRTGRLRGRPDHGPARARRADGRHPALADDEPRRALGLHALQRARRTSSTRSTRSRARRAASTSRAATSRPSRCELERIDRCTSVARRRSTCARSSSSRPGRDPATTATLRCGRGGGVPWLPITDAVSSALRRAPGALVR